MENGKGKQITLDEMIADVENEKYLKRKDGKEEDNTSTDSLRRFPR